MEVYDKNKIGKLVSWGSDHFVYNYGSDQVIKFSIIDFLLGKEGEKKVLHDYAVCEYFFGMYLLPTTIMRSPSGKRIAKVQQKIVGRPLTKADLARPKVRQQFLEIIDRYYAMITAGYAELDLTGQGGFFSRCLSNVFISPEDKLIILDAMLLEIKASTFLTPLVPTIRKIALHRQHFLIKNFLN